MVQQHVQGEFSDCDAAIQKVLPLYFHINYHINLVPTETDLLPCVQNIQTMCDHVICLTARSCKIYEKTLHELAKNNFNFYIPEFENLNLNLPYPSIYRHGVLFCGSNDKGNVLLSFLNAIHYIPQVIVFIDDKEKNLAAIERVIQKTDISYRLIRYAGCDFRVAAFNASETEKELAFFLEKYPCYSM
jgi:hypothetical protein